MRISYLSELIVALFSCSDRASLEQPHCRGCFSPQEVTQTNYQELLVSHIIVVLFAFFVVEFPSASFSSRKAEGRCHKKQPVLIGDKWPNVTQPKSEVQRNNVVILFVCFLVPKNSLVPRNSSVAYSLISECLVPTVQFTKVFLLRFLAPLYSVLSVPIYCTFSMFEEPT